MGFHHAGNLIQPWNDKQTFCFQYGCSLFCIVIVMYSIFESTSSSLFLDVVFTECHRVFIPVVRVMSDMM